MNIKTLTGDQLVAIVGKDAADELFLNKEWVRKNGHWIRRDKVKKNYPHQQKYLIYRQMYLGTSDDGQGNFEGFVEIIGLGISNLKKDLPEKIISVTGNFDCSYNNLTSLEGCPETVGRVFLCNNNQLDSLKYSPKTVGMNFVCEKNKLTSLDGISDEIGGNMIAEKNNFPEGSSIDRSEDGKTYELVLKGEKDEI